MQGWASFYDFNFSDVRSGADVVAAACGQAQPDWNKLRGLLENAIYGGRVDNARDVQVCQSVLGHKSFCKLSPTFIWTIYATNNGGPDMFL